MKKIYQTSLAPRSTTTKSWLGFAQLKLTYVVQEW